LRRLKLLEAGVRVGVVRLVAQLVGLAAW
jgi:hypothetical protein